MEEKLAEKMRRTERRGQARLDYRGEDTFARSENDDKAAFFDARQEILPFRTHASDSRVYEKSPVQRGRVCRGRSWAAAYTSASRSPMAGTGAFDPPGRTKMTIFQRFWCVWPSRHTRSDTLEARSVSIPWFLPSKDTLEARGVSISIFLVSKSSDREALFF